MTIWQFAVFGVLILAAVGAVWISKRFQGWLRCRIVTSSILVGVSSIIVAGATFTFLVVLFGFILDHSFAI